MSHIKEKLGHGHAITVNGEVMMYCDGSCKRMVIPSITGSDTEDGSGTWESTCPNCNELLDED